MSASRDDGNLRGIREIAARYIQANGLRKFSRETGLSPTGARQAVHGDTHLRGRTLLTLEKWAQETPDAGYVTGTGEGPALGAIRLLVKDLPRAEQRATAYHLYDVLRENYTKDGAPEPIWLAALRRLIRAEWP